MSDNSLAQRIEHVESRIREACRRAGRPREEVRTVAVTKYVPLATAEQVVQHGLIHIGENRWQDAKAKWEAIEGQAVWHFLGHLQTNKVKDIIGKFAYIHSLDRLSLAQELDRKAAAAGLTVNCFLQVNVSGEQTKYGLDPADLVRFAEQLRAFPRLVIVGLMTMAPIEAEPEQTRPVFRGLRELRTELNDKAVLPQPITELSMGMSGDFEVAIEEGATWIRLGSVLVGREG